jgi:hypothetical protein
MGNTRLADIPGNEFVGGQLDNASVASNGAGALVGYVFVAPADINIVNAWWTPTGADTTANTGSYRTLKLVNAGADGAGTTVIGSIVSTVTRASNVPVAFSGSGSVASGSAVGLSHSTVGGNHSDGTVLIAGRVSVTYQLQ